MKCVLGITSMGASGRERPLTHDNREFATERKVR